MFFVYCYASPRALHSFPTRRSSDLRGLQPQAPGDLMALDVEDLRVYYRTLRGDVQALDGVTFQIADGEIMGLADRKSTRLNSSHVAISYAVFCLKKKKYTIFLMIDL